MKSTAADGVLILYTGGTLGSLRKDSDDPHSPLEPAPLEAVLGYFPDYDPERREITLGRRRIRLGLETFDPPLDSSDIGPDDWVRIARIIDENYDRYEGFVILHGTDTLAYTSSALAFILRNLRKPVVLTGSQRPIGEVRSDAEQNLITAVEIAAAAGLGRTVVPEVCVFFRDHLYRGCRTTKVSAVSYNAFASPNLPPLATAGATIVVDEDLLCCPEPRPLAVRTRFEHNVASLDVTPGMPVAMLRAFFGIPGLKGAVLRTYGSGNAPSSREFLDAVAEAVERGVVVMNATQCLEGEVSPGKYATSAALLARGVIGSLDMTREAALTKMFTVLGEEPDPSLAADLLQLDLAGEQRWSVFHLHFPPGRLDPGASTTLMPLREMAGRSRFRPQAVEEALLSMTGVRLEGIARGTVRVGAVLDAAPERGDHPGNLGTVARSWIESRGVETLFLPATRAVRELVDHRHTNELTLVNLGDRPLLWNKLELVCRADVGSL